MKKTTDATTNTRYEFDSPDEVYAITDALITFDGWKKPRYREDFDSNGFVCVGSYTTDASKRIAEKLASEGVIAKRDRNKASRFIMYVNEYGTTDIYVGSAIASTLLKDSENRLANNVVYDARLFPNVECKTTFRTITDAFTALGALKYRKDTVKAVTLKSEQATA